MPLLFETFSLLRRGSLGCFSLVTSVGTSSVKPGKADMFQGFAAADPALLLDCLVWFRAASLTLFENSDGFAVTVARTFKS